MATDIAFAVGVLALLGRRVLPALRGCHSFLWISVAVLDQLRKLPEDIGNALPISHHRRLLGVKDDEVKLALATKAVEEDLTVNELEAEVATARPEDKPNPGRKPLPAFAKAIRALKPTDVTVRALAALGAAEIEHLIGILDAPLAALRALREALQKGLDAQTDAPPRRRGLVAMCLPRGRRPNARSARGKSPCRRKMQRRGAAACPRCLVHARPKSAHSR